MDWNLFFTITGTGVTTVGLIYAFLWNFKSDILSRFEKMENRFDKLEEKVLDIDRRLCRIEGSLSTQVHCLFNQPNPQQKVE